MGHRTLVAYERPDGHYDLHYAHWGGADLRLREAITPETPFGGRSVEHPIATGLGFEAVLDRLDVGVHEAFYVVSPAFDVTAYLVLPFGPPGDPGGRGGALVEIRPDERADAADALRTWFEGVRQAAWDMHDWGLLAERAVRAYLADALRRWTAGREVVVVGR